MNEKIIIGIDLGGTKIMTGAISHDGKVLCTPKKILTGATDPCELILKRITDSVEGILKTLNATLDNVEGIGVGTTGPLDIDAGVILECPQLPTMHYFPLRSELEQYFKVPVFVNNDANCLIFGEYMFGAAKGKENVVGFTLGTGIGCAIVLNGKIINGSTGSAAEIWPSPYYNGTIEDFISGKGVSGIYEKITGKVKTSLEVYNLAAEGDEDALLTWRQFGEHLAVPIAWSVNLLDPEVVILGGSISSAYKFFGNPMEENLRKWICPVPAQKTKVVIAALGDYAGFIGAACLVLAYK